MSNIVESYPRPSQHFPIAAIGEAPGYVEYCQGRPLVGPTGQEHRKLLFHNRINPRLVFRSNIVREYKDGDPDPTEEDIKKWTPVLEKELSTVRPKLILALGRFASECFLGPIPLKYAMRSINGIPHEGGCFNSQLSHRSYGAVVLPIIHPAAGLREGKSRTLVAWAYEQAGNIWRIIQQGGTIDMRRK